jgi:hypothetical protein
VAAERLFIPADPVFTSQLAGCSVRMGAGQDGLLALSSVQLPGGGYKPILVIVITWTETELHARELDPTAPGGWRCWHAAGSLLTPMIPLNQVS